MRVRAQGGLIGRVEEPAGKRPLAIQLLPADGIGGVEIAARSTLSLSAARCDFAILLLAGLALADHPAIIGSAFASSNRPGAHLAALRQLWRRRPDVLIASLWRTTPVAIVYKLLRPRTRLVYFLHVDRTVHVVDRISSRLALMLADEVWSDAAASMIARGVPVGKPRRVISFVLDRLPRVEMRTIAASFVAWCRILPQKGLDRGIALIAALRRRGVAASYDIWGPDDGEQASLAGLAQASGVADSIRFRGIAGRAALPEIAARHSFYLQLSRFEGMAVATVEAMQLGLVPVVTPVGEMAAYCSDGVNALLVDPADLDEAAARIADLVGQPAAVSRLADAAAAYWTGRRLYREDVEDAIMALVSRRAGTA